MMSLQRTSSEAVTSAMTSDAFKVNGDATEPRVLWGDFNGDFMGEWRIFIKKTWGEIGRNASKR